MIVVTADAGSTIDADCQAAGADEVILKPVSMTNLYDTIGALLAKRRGGEVMLA